MKQVHQQEQGRKRFDTKEEEEEMASVAPVPHVTPQLALPVPVSQIPDKTRKQHQFEDLQRHTKSSNSSPASDSNSRSPAVNNAISERDRLRQREQERRRREAVCDLIIIYYLLLWWIVNLGVICLLVVVIW